MSWEVVSYWIENHPGLASWVQAVGSILAIIMATLIANSDSRARRRAEKEARLGALLCSITAVVDAQARVIAGFAMAKKTGVSHALVDAIKFSFKNSEGHLKEVMSIDGVDSKIYIHLYAVRIALEEAVHLLDLVSNQKTSGEDILSRLSASLESLIKMRNSKG